MKKIIAVTFILMSLLCMFETANAYNTYVYDDVFTYRVLDNGTVTLVYPLRNTHPKGQITIPSSVYYHSKAYSVESIAYGALSGCDEITSISISRGITSIGEYAFSGCVNATRITIPSSVEVIKNNAFDGCKSLTNITIPNGVRYINEFTFRNCVDLKSITIPNSVISIDNNAFEYCASLTSIKIPNSIIIIENNAFDGCTSLTNITIPDSVTSIGQSAFRDCWRLTTFNFNATNCTYMGDSDYPVFEHCTALQYVNIGKNVTNIPPYAFENCDLTSVEISDNVKSIGNGAFRWCTDLTSITIPTGITSIGEDAFENCESLKTVYYNATNCKTMGSSSASAFGYRSQIENIIIGENVINIPSYAFAECTNLFNISIPKNVISIGENAFYDTGYYNDKNNWNNDVLYIGSHLIKADNKLTNSYVIKQGTICVSDYAFEDCTKITIITMPDSLKGVGPNSFKGCTGITTVNYNATNCEITNTLYRSIFMDSISLKTVNIGETTTHIPPNIFQGCNSLTNITIPNSVISIGRAAFASCTGLTNITIPDGVTRIDEYAFENCTSLINISIPNSATSIGYDAFYKTGYYNNANNWDNDVLYIDSYLAEAKNTLSGSYAIKQGTICIGGYAFGNCKSLTDITIPNSIISIGSEAFASCTGLTNITIPDGVTSIESRAFYGCTGLSSIFIPNSVIFIDGTSFEKSTKVTLRGLSDSYAQNYAKRCNIPFIAVGESKFVAQKSVINNNIIITATIPTAYFDNVLYVACYDDNDKFLKLIPKENYTNGEEILISNDSNISYIKVLLWESSSNLKPLVNAVILDM